jgi:HK97 gp10 family phage protein
MGRSRVQGGSRLRKKLRFMPEAATAELKQVIAKSAVDVYDAIRDLAPIEIGRMRESLNYRLSSDKLGAAIGYSKRRSGFRRAWKVGGFEAQFIEFGTKKMSAHPFIRPGFRSQLNSILDNVDKATDRALRRAAGLKVSDQ